MNYNECAINLVPPYTLRCQTPGVWDAITTPETVQWLQSVVPGQQFSWPNVEVHFTANSSVCPHLVLDCCGTMLADLPGCSCPQDSTWIVFFLPRPDDLTSCIKW